jgi:hypothetical protein
MDSRTAALMFSLSMSLTACETDAEVPADAGSSDTGDGDTGDGDGDGDTGDGDTGDGDGDPGDGDGDTGDGDGDGDPDGDPLQAAMCESLLNDTPQPLLAAASAGEAATAPVLADGHTVYLVTLPEGAAGFVELQIPDWETTQAFFTVQDIEYTITTEANAQTPGAREPVVDVCSDAGITDQRVFFPHWTPATIEFDATGPREIPLMIIRE